MSGCVTGTTIYKIILFYNTDKSLSAHFRRGREGGKGHKVAWIRENYIFGNTIKFYSFYMKGKPLFFILSGIFKISQTSQIP